VPAANEGRPFPLNTPTIFNAALNFRLNWAGNFRSLESQVFFLWRASVTFRGLKSISGLNRMARKR